MHLTQPNDLRILVVDDDSAVRQVITLLLLRDGYDVHAVDNGYDALAQLGKAEFNIVVTDFSMPGMKGDELAASIKHLYPGLPIIMVTALAADSSTVDLLSGKVDVLVVKPFTREDLRNAIQYVLSHADAGHFDEVPMEISRMRAGDFILHPNR